jgi:uncharacterized membrane protein
VESRGPQSASGSPRPTTEESFVPSARSLLCSAVLLCATLITATNANAAVVVCSQYQASSVHFAMARYEQGRMFVRGWFNVDPGRCITIDQGFAAGPYAFYAYSDTTKTQWPPTKTGVEHCMKFKQKFTVEYPITQGRVICPDGYATRFFQRFEPVNGDIRINLK